MALLRPDRHRLHRHVAIGSAISAWLRRLHRLARCSLCWIAIGRDDVDRRAGVRRSTAVTAARVLGVATGGILATLSFGATIGGWIAALGLPTKGFERRGWR